VLKITFLINGRPVEPSNIGNALEAALLKATQSALAEKLASVRCPDHQQEPEITARGQSFKELSFEVKGCCEKLIEMTKAQLA
jgi:hypothetical protein